MFENLFKSKGERNFDGCQNRDPLTVKAIGGMIEATLTCEGKANGMNESSVFDFENRRHHIENETSARLIEKVAKSACQNCVFANMTPDQVDVHKGELAASRAIRLQGETDLRIAEARRALVDREIAQQLGNPNRQI